MTRFIVIAVSCARLDCGTAKKGARFATANIVEMQIIAAIMVFRDHEKTPSAG
jgi:hypothetical protein